jgi:hypothetical protein
MSWVVTLKVTSCSGGSNLAGAAINDGYQFFYTDANGQFIAIVDDSYYAYIVQISKAGYIPKSFTLHNSQSGSIQTVCLETASGTGTGTGTGGTGTGLSCFIVSAATGSPQSDEVVLLRDLRGAVAERSAVAARLIDGMYEEYSSFSPGVADWLDSEAAARDNALTVVVAPLVAWYRLAGALALDGDDPDAAELAIADAELACSDALVPWDAARLFGKLAKGESPPADLPAALAGLADELAPGADLPLVRWAVLEPLSRMWGSVVRGLDLTNEIERWLATAPLELVEPPCATCADTELRQLASLLDFSPSARAELARRIESAWPDAAHALTRSGLVEG